jgi:hypothetical protein
MPPDPPEALAPAAPPEALAPPAPPVTPAPALPPAPPLPDVIPEPPLFESFGTLGSSLHPAEKSAIESTKIRLIK